MNKKNNYELGTPGPEKGVGHEQTPLPKFSIITMYLCHLVKKYNCY